MKKYIINEIQFFLPRQLVNSYYMLESFTHFYRSNGVILAIGPDVCCKVSTGGEVTLVARSKNKQHSGITHGLMSEMIKSYYIKPKIKPKNQKSSSNSPIAHLLNTAGVVKNFSNMFA